MNTNLIDMLEYRAAKARRKVLRMVEAGKSGHLGGAFSCIDIITALYFHTMQVDPHNPKMADRDRFILSAGHKCMAQYAVLCERGFFSEEILDTYGHLGTILPGHPDMNKLPGIEANTGALGHGLSIAVGMSLGLLSSGQRVYVILGDGELPEGSNWEAFMAAGHYKANNLVAFIDVNGLQISGKTHDIMDMQPIAQKVEAFGWASKTIDGNNMCEIVELLDSLVKHQEKPTAIVMRTVKGKGLSFAEDQIAFHYWKPTEQEMELARRELDESIRVREAALQ